MPLDQVDVDALEREEGEMSFLEHLEALRWHIARAALAIVLVAIGVFVAKDFVFGTIIFGPTRADFVSIRALCSLGDALGMSNAFCIDVPTFKFITPVFGEAFIVHLRVSATLGFIASFPYVFWEIWRFIRPGLYPDEQRAARGIVLICSLLFALGVAFGYFVISPFAVNFLMSYELPGVTPEPALSSYISYLTLFTLPAGFVFQLPVLVYFLARVGLVSSAGMRTYRRHAFVVLLILSAILTPPDPLTQVMLGLPLYTLYELSIVVARRVERRAAEAEVQSV